MDKDKKYMDAYNKFYEFKSKWDNKFSGFKRSKKMQLMSAIEKKIAIEDFQEKRKCVNCGKIGGTNFEETAEYLKATCNASKPCDLHIEIMKGKPIYYKDDIYESYEQKIHLIKQKITKTKLKLLFNLDQEDVLVKDFQDNKNELINTAKEFNLIKHIFESQDKMSVDTNADITELKHLSTIEQENNNGEERKINENASENHEGNKDATGEDDGKFIKRKTLIKNHEKDLEKSINEYNKIIRDYKTLNDEDKLTKFNI